MSLQLSAGEATATGPRAENQDALRIVTPTPALAASKGSLFALADGVSQCADGGLAARSTLQALALDYYATPQTWNVAFHTLRIPPPSKPAVSPRWNRGQARSRKESVPRCSCP